ncbi:MAG: hypothetical protein GWN85_41345, partial [Gemmatimonadetes bacterium]|nr:hypothetical protein [Gemmatimonadota bacterium]
DLVATAPGLEEEEEGFCTNCHDADGPAATDIAADFAFTINWVDQAVGEQDLTTLNDRHDVQYAASSVSGAKVECADCHNPHVATAAQPWTSDPDPANTPTLAGQGFTPYSEFCLDCHDGTLPAGVLDHTGGPMTNIDVAFSAASKKDRHGLNAAKSTNLDPATTGW